MHSKRVHSIFPDLCPCLIFVQSRSFISHPTTTIFYPNATNTTSAYRGEVVSYDGASKFYKIRYSDGDDEEMDAKDMRVHVVPSTATRTDDAGAATKNDDAKKTGAKKAGTKKAVSSEINVKAGDDAGDGAKKGGAKKAPLASSQPSTRLGRASLRRPMVTCGMYLRPSGGSPARISA